MPLPSNTYPYRWQYSYSATATGAGPVVLVAGETMYAGAGSRVFVLKATSDGIVTELYDGGEGTSYVTASRDYLAFMVTPREFKFVSIR